jgi:hypothetical protein
MLNKYMGKDITNIVTSSPIDEYPLLICLSFEEGQARVLATMNAFDTIHEIMNRLDKAHDLFDQRIVTPPPTTQLMRSSQ